MMRRNFRLALSTCPGSRVPLVMTLHAVAVHYLPRATLTWLTWTHTFPHVHPTEFCEARL